MDGARAVAGWLAAATPTQSHGNPNEAPIPTPTNNNGIPDEAARPNAGAIAAEAAPDMDRPVKPRYVAGYVIVFIGCPGSGCGGRYCDGGSL